MRSQRLHTLPYANNLQQPNLLSASTAGVQLTPTLAWHQQ
jgi:hypothetical protein